MPTKRGNLRTDLRDCSRVRFYSSRYQRLFLFLMDDFSAAASSPRPRHLELRRAGIPPVAGPQRRSSPARALPEPCPGRQTLAAAGCQVVPDGSDEPRGAAARRQAAAATVGRIRAPVLIGRTRSRSPGAGRPSSSDRPRAGLGSPRGTQRRPGLSARRGTRAPDRLRPGREPPSRDRTRARAPRGPPLGLPRPQ